MGLEPHHAIDHLRAYGLQRIGPVDVGLFIKARLELHHSHDFLAQAHSFGQQGHQLRLGARAVNRLLDGHHAWVVHGFAQQLQHSVKLLKRLVNQHIFFAHLLHDAAPMLQLPGPAGLPGRKQHARVVDQINQLGQSYQIHRPIHTEHGFTRQLKLLQQCLQQKVGAATAHLQPHGLTKLAVHQFLAQGCAQVVHLILFD